MEIGRSLLNMVSSLLLCIGTTLAICYLSGKIPFVKHWFKINVTGLHISLSMCFNTIGDIPSTPLLAFDGSLSIMFNTSTSVILLNVNS